MIIPNSDIYLLKTEIDMDNQNQLLFNSLQAQLNYFSSLDNQYMAQATYQRKDNQLYFDGSFDVLVKYNYCMYRNTEYTDKWFFAYVTDIRYVNDNCCAIDLKTDVFQTWMFDLEFKRSFVEREHVNDDTIGLHTIPEALETGEYISTDLQPYKRMNKITEDGEVIWETSLETCFCIASAESIFQTYSTLNEKLPSGLFYFGFETLQGVEDALKIYASQNKTASINSIFVIPKEFFSSWATSDNISGKVSRTVKFTGDAHRIEIPRVNYIGKNYVPRNNKLKCFPYSYLQVSNHNGSVVNYNWEEFNLLNIPGETPTNDAIFILRGALTPGGSYVARPLNYKNIYDNFDDSITLGKYPMGGWNSETYTNWLSENGLNIAMGLVTGGIGMVNTINKPITSNAFSSGVSDTAGGIIDTLSQVYTHSLIPSHAMGNTNVGDYTFAYDYLNLEFKQMSIKNEYAEIIDGFFDMYGYKVNKLKVPNIRGRRNWNYVKTIGANIHGYIPQKDMQEIKNMFDAGVTLWHNPNTFLDYSQNNDII